MANVGVKTTVKTSGTSTATTAEATTFVSGSNPNKIYQITNTVKRVLDPAVAIVIKDAGTPVSTALYTIDYMFGRVLFAGYTQTGAITFDANYIPTLAIAEGYSADWERTRLLLDVTIFHATDTHKKRLAGLKDCKGSVKFRAFVGTDLDVGTGGEQSIDTYFGAGVPKLIEIDPTGTGVEIFRAWVLFPKLSQMSDVAGLVDTPFDFEGTNLPGANGIASNGWGS